jgi:hypothetical protein
MARVGNSEKLAALEKQKADLKAKRKAEDLILNRKIRAMQSRERTQTERNRSHVGIVIGVEIIEHAVRNPASEVRRVIIRIAENHLRKRPEDKSVADLLAMLKDAPAHVGGSDADKLDPTKAAE